MKINNQIIIILIILSLLDVFFWIYIFKKPVLKVYFFNIKKNEISFLNFRNKVKVLINIGPSLNSTLDNLSKLLPFYDRYIDLVIISKPKKNCFNNLPNLLNYYKIGAIILNGDFERSPFDKVISKIKSKKIPIIILGQGDKIVYGNNKIDILWPNLKEWLGFNSPYLVFDFSNPKIKILFSDNISLKVKEKLAKLFNLKSDILKISYRNSKQHFSKNFLKKVKPKISIVNFSQKVNSPFNNIVEYIKNLGSNVYMERNYDFLSVIISNKIQVFAKKK